MGSGPEPLYARGVRLSLVIATLQRPGMLAVTLATLARCDPLPAEVIVVDGDEAASAAPVVAGFAETLGSVPIRYLSARPGTSQQRNEGTAAATGDIVVFADDDVEFDPGVFGALAAAYGDQEVVGATGQVLESAQRRIGGTRTRLRRLLGGPEGTMTSFGYPRRITEPTVARDVEFMHGCLMSARRELALECRFDVNLPGYGLAEDEDFGYRLSRVGRVRYVPEAHVVHARQGFRSIDRRKFDRMLVRNRTYLFRKSFPQTAVTRLQFAGLLGVLAVHRALNREWRGLLGLVEGVADVAFQGPADRALASLRPAPLRRSGRRR